MKITSIALIAALCLLFTVTNTFCQDTIKRTKSLPRCYFVSVGLGGSSLGAYSTMVKFNVEIKNQWLLGANFMSETNTKLFNGRSDNETDVNTTNLLAGKIFKQYGLIGSLSTGLGLVEVYTRNNNNGTLSSTGIEQTKHTVGIPIVAQGYVVLFKTVGLGLGAYANINTIKTTAGFSLNFALGYMPTHK
jgi:hypothetical protein